MLKRPKILVVDDEPTIVDTLTMILERGGFEASGAYSGRAAIRAARASQPDFLLTDVMMPDKNGVEVAAEVQTVMPDCVVILFSGDLDKARALVLAHPGRPKWELLSKPLSPETLLRKPERMLNSRRPTCAVNGRDREKAARQA